MTKFALNDKDFDSAKAQVPGTNKVLELLKLGKDEYVLLEHIGNSVGELVSLTKEEFKTLWILLTVK